MFLRWVKLYLKVFSKELKYVAKQIKISMFLNIELKIYSDESDEEISDKEVSKEE